jgi:hypothetical protein
VNAGVNQSIARFGESVKHFFRAQQRSAMTSPMFNLPGRLLLGSYCYLENLPTLLEQLRQRASEEDIGRAMKRLCNRPNYVHLNSLALGYLVGREQARLCGRNAGDEAATVSVMEFWSRVARSYRNDGCLLPDEAAFTVPILSPQAVGDLNRNLSRNIPEPLRRQIHRLVATTELYTFILHGEARVGVFHHGPYPLEDGDSLIVKELVGLREDFYPWARLTHPLPCDNIACVMRLHDVRSKIVLFGSLTTEPPDYARSISAEALFVVTDGGFRPLPDSEIAPLTRAAADAQLELYRQVIDWDEPYRIAYGAELYGYLLKSFGDQLGMGAAFAEDIRRSFRVSVERHLEDLCSGREQARVLQHIATTGGPLFAPLSGAGAGSS